MEEDPRTLRAEFSFMLNEAIRRGETIEDAYEAINKTPYPPYNTMDLSIEDSSKYADYATKHSPTRVGMEMMAYLPPVLDSVIYSNLAYVSLHASDDHIRVWAEKKFHSPHEGFGHCSII